LVHSKRFGKALKIRTSAIVISQNDAGTCAAIEVIAREILATGSRVAFIDASALQPKSEMFQRYDLTRVYSKYSKHSPLNHIRNFSHKSNVSILSANKQTLRKFQNEGRELSSMIPQTIEEIEAWSTTFPRLGRSLASVLCTDIARSSHPVITKYVPRLEKQIRHYLANYYFLKSAIEEITPDEVVVFNGRRPNTAAVLDASDACNTEFRYFETNWDGRIFFESFSPHNRELVQTKSFEKFKLLDPSEIDSDVQAFIDSRSKEVNRNQFIRNFDSSESVASERTERIVVLTSSPDEFIGVGDSWKPSSWRNQEEAIEEVVRALSKKGRDVIIRMHPNTLNKTWREYLRQVIFYSTLNCKVIRPESRVNTYDLISTSSGVVVWASTIGLESAVRGIPTWTLSPNLYDLKTGLKNISNRSEAIAEDYDPYKINVRDLYPAIIGMQRGYCWLDRQSDYFEILNETSKHVSNVKKLENLFDRGILPFRILDKLKFSPDSLNRWLVKLFGVDKAEEYWTRIISNKILMKINNL
jgi:hypothetical protein